MGFGRALNFFFFLIQLASIRIGAKVRQPFVAHVSSTTEDTIGKFMCRIAYLERGIFFLQSVNNNKLPKIILPLFGFR